MAIVMDIKNNCKFRCSLFVLKQHNQHFSCSCPPSLMTGRAGHLKANTDNAWRVTPRRTTTIPSWHTTIRTNWISCQIPQGHLRRLRTVDLCLIRRKDTFSGWTQDTHSHTHTHMYTDTDKHSSPLSLTHIQSPPMVASHPMCTAAQLWMRNRSIPDAAVHIGILPPCCLSVFHDVKFKVWSYLCFFVLWSFCFSSHADSLLGTSMSRIFFFSSSALLCYTFDSFSFMPPSLTCLPNVMSAYCMDSRKGPTSVASNSNWQINTFIHPFLK